MILTITLWLLILDGFIISFAITQKVMDWNILPVNFEGISWALIISYQVMTAAFFIGAKLIETKNSNQYLENIFELLRKLDN